jgi:mRNA interferase MazF
MLNRGDLIWVARYDTQGHELTGRHPAVVVSPTAYNQATKMAIICGVTTTVRGNKFEVTIPENNGITGAVKIDSIQNIDWNARKYEVVGKLPQEQLAEVLEKLIALFAG